MCGVEIPVEGVPHWNHFTAEEGGLPRDLPLVVDFATGFYVRREGPGLSFGGRQADLLDLAADATRRLPVIGELPVRSSWWGFYENSPDRNAIVGSFEEPQHFYVETGFSGHGFMQAPAIGEHVAELVAGAPVRLDLGAFAPERFSRSERREELLVI
jgi:glycine/D-amino acid oxidase-like deaminating enzyme